MSDGINNAIVLIMLRRMINVRNVITYSTEPLGPK